MRSVGRTGHVEQKSEPPSCKSFYCAKCPELDLVTELPTADAALEDLIEAIQDYAKEYLRERDRYTTSLNRSHHLPYIEAIAACKTDWELRTLIEIKHGLVHV
ncbi:MAG: hypothetical protein EWM72_00981 [Nitrospira sp.]|nr:MAG: hypothetical protein EWM72_00981 [Nitrospira sp.]